MKQILLIAMITIFFMVTGFADDDGLKKEKTFKNNEKSYEVANENAKFKRDENWTKKKDRDDKIEGMKENKEKKIKKEKKMKKDKMSKKAKKNKKSKK